MVLGRIRYEVVLSWVAGVAGGPWLLPGLLAPGAAAPVPNFPDLGVRPGRGRRHTAGKLVPHGRDGAVEPPAAGQGALLSVMLHSG